MKSLCAILCATALALALSGCKQCGSEKTSTTTPPTSTTPGPKSAAAPEKTSLQSPPPAGKPNDRASLGTNLGPIEDWSPERPFIDVFRMSRKMFSGSANAWDDSRPLDTDEHGWLRSLAPGQIARVLIFTDTPRFPAGRYVVLYDGKGTVEYGGTARLDAAASKPGRHVVDLDPARGDFGLLMNITAVDPKDPMRNIRVLPPGGACQADPTRYCDAETPCPTGACLDFEKHHEQLVFHPDFLSRITRYGMLRFMDMMRTNNSEIRTWDDRPKLTDATWTTHGVPIPIMTKLANQLHAQPWFCIPHLADDDYVRRFARAVKKQVDPDLPIWVEYSNEVWNGMFKQNQFAGAQGKAMGHENVYQGAMRYYAKRSLDVLRIFEEELGKDRLVRVVASQAGNAWAAGEILSYPGLADHADALAIAPYFGWLPSAEDLPKVHEYDVKELIAYTRQKALPEAQKYVQAHAELARKHGLKLVAYEAGQHFVGVMGGENDPHLNEIFDAINRHPEMKKLYLSYLDSWKDAGGLWLNHYLNCGAYSKWGRWGALEHLHQPREQAPKYDALMTFMENNPRWW